MVINLGTQKILLILSSHHMVYHMLEDNNYLLIPEQSTLQVNWGSSLNVMSKNLS